VVSNYSSVAHANTVRPQHPNPRPDASALVDSVFAQLDTTNKGYLNKADVQTAYDKIASSNNSSVASSSDSASKTDAVFKALDSNSDGHITKQEFKDSLQKLSDQLDAHFNNSRTKVAGQDEQVQEAKGPPPPPQGGDKHTEKTESSGSSSASSTNSNTAKSYDPADTNQDGIVSEEERLAYTQSHTTASSSSNQDNEAEILRRISQLLKAYGSSAHNSTSTSNTTTTESKSSVSVAI